MATEQAVAVFIPIFIVIVLIGATLAARRRGFNVGAKLEERTHGHARVESRVDNWGVIGCGRSAPVQAGTL